SRRQGRRSDAGLTVARVRGRPSWFRRLGRNLRIWGLLRNESFVEAFSKSGMFLTDTRRGPLIYSDFWKSVVGDESIVGLSWIDRVHADDRPRVLEEWNRADRGGEDFTQSEFRIRRSDGGYEWVASRYWVLERSPRGRILAYLGQDLSLRSVKGMQEDFRDAAQTASRALEDEDIARSLGLELVGARTNSEIWNRILIILPRLFS